MGRWCNFIYRNAEKNAPHGIAEQAKSDACALWFNTVWYLLYGIKANTVWYLLYGMKATPYYVDRGMRYRGGGGHR